eukprot:5204074-Karenia_brevis.AAC.1
MRVVSRRRKKFEKQSRVIVKRAYEEMPESKCRNEACHEERSIQLVEGDEAPQRMILDFQVAEVSKPLLAVKRIAENGNIVVFGPGEEDNSTLNRKTGDK